VLLAGLVHLAATLIMTWPYVSWTTMPSAIYVGDARFLAWLISWNSHAWLTGLPVFDANGTRQSNDAIVLGTYAGLDDFIYLPMVQRSETTGGGP